MIKTVTVAGVDLCSRYGLLLSGYELTPPEPKTYLVDIPYGDGSVDATEAVSGDVAFSDRKLTFEFTALEAGAFESTKTALAAFLHGRRFDFALSWDPGYTYTGRFSLDEFAPHGTIGCIRVEVTCEPYKLREHVRARVAGGGGRSATLACGRRRQRPTVECPCECVVYIGGASVRLQPGTWRPTGLWLEQGDNEVWVDTTPGGGDVSVSALLGTGAVSEALGESRVGDLFWSSKPADDESLAVWFEYDIKEL